MFYCRVFSYVAVCICQAFDNCLLSHSCSPLAFHRFSTLAHWTYCALCFLFFSCLFVLATTRSANIHLKLIFVCITNIFILYLLHSCFVLLLQMYVWVCVFVHRLFQFLHRMCCLIDQKFSSRFALRSLLLLMQFVIFISFFSLRFLFFWFHSNKR